MLQIQLTAPQLMTVGAEAMRRTALVKDHYRTEGRERNFETEATGMKGEIAFSLLYGVPWLTQPFDQDFPGIEIKTRTKRSSLIIKPSRLYKNPPSTRFVLAFSPFESASVYFLGWITGDDFEQHPKVERIDYNGEALALDYQYLIPMEKLSVNGKVRA